MTSNGFLFTWGGNDSGQLGLPHAAEVATQIQASRTASERKRVNRRVNQRFLSAMAEMGIPSDQAELALHETGNVGVEVATEWLFSVPQVGRNGAGVRTGGGERGKRSRSARHSKTSCLALLMHSLAACSLLQDVLETHLAGEPGTPQEEVGAVHDDDRVLVPKRVALQVGRSCAGAGALRVRAQGREK